MVTLGGIPRHPATLLAALCIASWIRLGEVADNVDDVIAEACAAKTGSGDSCFRLYSPVEAASWLEADDFCRTRELRLATVQDSQAQEALVNLSRSFQCGSSTKHAWIAGRRSTDGTWRATDSSLSYDVSDDTGQHCSQLIRTDPDINFNLKAAPCIYTGLTNASSLCQYQRTSGRCEDGWFPLGDQCFQVVTQERGSWYAGRADCRGAGPPGVEGELAYIHLGDPRLFQVLPPEPPYRLWVGVYRNPWVWQSVERKGRHEEMEEISEFFWVPGQGTWSNLSDCLYADLTNGSSWGDRPCNGSLDYVICEQETTPAPGSSQSPPRASLATDLSNQRTTATSSIVTDGNVTATQAVKRLENSILIGCLAGGIGVLSLVVIILVIMLRRRKKESNPKPPPIHTGLDGSPYAVTTIVTSPETAGNNNRVLPNSDDASWTWENHMTPSRPLEPGVPGSASPRPVEGDYDEPWDDIMTRLGLQPPEPDLISQASARGPPGSIPMATLRAERWAGGELEPRPPAVPIKHPDLAVNPYRRSIQPAS